MKTTTDTSLAITADYRKFIEDLKARVATARVSSARKINHELILLYWDIGRAIVEKQQVLGWGDAVVEMIAADLQSAFPGSKGFSPQNVWRMQQFYLVHNQQEFLSQLARETSKRGANRILRQPVRPYADPRSTGKHSLLHRNAHGRSGGPALPAGCVLRAPRGSNPTQGRAGRPRPAGHFAEQADEMLKSSYNLEFLGLRRAGPKAQPYSSPGQRPGYCIKRKPRAVGPTQFLGLPAGIGRAFSPRVFLSGVPGALPQAGMACAFGAHDIGLAWCLRSKANPIGVAAYELQSKLPGELKEKLPTAKQLANVVRGEMGGK